MRIKRILAATLAVLTIIFVNISPGVIYADESEDLVWFDVSGLCDGKIILDARCCKFDLYLNGKLACSQISDVWLSLPVGTQYEIKNINFDPKYKVLGYYYDRYGVNSIVQNFDTIKGTIVSSYNNAISFVFDCRPTNTTFHRNFNESDIVTSNQSFEWCTSQQYLTVKEWNRSGYTLLGWSADKNATEAEYSTLYEVDNDWLLNHYSSTDLYAVWQPNTYDVVINPNGGTIEKDDSTDMTKNDDGSISLSPTYDSNDFNSVNISPSRTGYTFDGIYDADTDGNQVWDSNGAFVEGKYWDKNGNWIYDGNVTLYCHWKAINYTMTFNYNKNGELTNADIDNKTVTYDSPYGELPNPGCAGWTFKEWNTKADGSGSTITKDDICKGDISVYALWSYKPVNVSVPQTLIGDKNGNSEFVVKSDDIESGSIDVTIPDGFYYNQEGKSPVYASISTDGDSKLTKDNTAIKYSIITDGLTAGCWSGSFNINLKLNK